MNKDRWMMYKVYFANGEYDEVYLRHPMSLRRMQRLVEGYIETAWGQAPYESNLYIFNEEGLLKGLPQNPHLGLEKLVGNVIECKTMEERGMIGFDVPAPIFKKCPNCNKKRNMRFPALSRKDNKTEICSHCGMLEGLEALAFSKGRVA